MKKKILSGQRREVVKCHYAAVTCAYNKTCCGCEIIDILLKEKSDQVSILNIAIEAYRDAIEEIINSANKVL